MPYAPIIAAAPAAGPAAPLVAAGAGIATLATLLSGKGKASKKANQITQYFETPFGQRLNQLVEEAKTDPTAYDRIQQEWDAYQAKMQSYAQRGGDWEKVANQSLANLKPLLGQILLSRLPIPNVPPPAQPPEPPPETTRQPQQWDWLLPGAVSAGLSVIGAITQKKSAQQAVEAQTEGARYAADLERETAKETIAALTQAQAEALGFSREVWEQARKDIEPWRAAGEESLRTLRQMTRAIPEWQRTFAAPTPETMQVDPSFRFRLAEGQKAIERAAAARGSAMSPATLKAITRYGQDVASQEYGNIYERAREDYDKAYNIFANERAARLNPLFSLAGLGQTSTGQLTQSGEGFAGRQGNILLGTAGNIGNISMATARDIGDIYQSAAATRASGYMAGSQAWRDALSNIGGNVMDAYWLSRMRR